MLGSRERLTLVVLEVHWLFVGHFWRKVNKKTEIDGVAAPRQLGRNDQIHRGQPLFLDHGLCVDRSVALTLRD